MAIVNIRIPVSETNAPGQFTTLSINSDVPLAQQISIGRFTSEASRQAFINLTESTLPASATRNAGAPPRQVGRDSGLDVGAELGGGFTVQPTRIQGIPSGVSDPSGLDVGAELGGGPTPITTPPSPLPSGGGLTREGTSTQRPFQRIAPTAGGGLVKQTQPGVPIGEIATTGDGAGQVDPQLEALKRITTQFNAGQFANVDAVVAEIGRVLGVDRNRALNFLEVIRPDFTRSLESTTQIAPDTRAGAAGGVPTPAVQQVAPPDPGDIANRNLRQELFADQPQNLVRRRAIGQTFGELTPFAFNAANNAFSRFQQTDPITSFAGELAGDAPELGNRFAGFLGGAQPTRETLGTDLNAILAANAGGGPSAALFATQFGQDPRLAANAAIQPFLQGLSPRLRGGVGRTLGNQFDTRFSQQPDQFQDPQSIVDLFGEFQRRGFF